MQRQKNLTSNNEHGTSNEHGARIVKTRKMTARKRNLLIELGTEELPPKSLKLLSQEFSQHFFKVLVENGLVEDGNGNGNYQAFATPRRLAIWVKDVAYRQADKIAERTGPALKIAFDDNGNPTKAAEGFAKSCGVAVSRLKKVETDEGGWLVHSRKVRGETLAAVVTQALGESIKNLTIPKRMRWGEKDVEFIRPVHWLLALYGSDLVKTEVLGLKSTRYSRGHRFHAPGPLKILSADRYQNTLKTMGFVIADAQDRRSMIQKQAKRLAARQGGIVVMEDALLDEVTGLVELPIALLGEFDQEFLTLPKEVLISTMKDHQKHFYVTDTTGALAPMFITVSNIKSKAPKRVRQGNERVLRARLSDARFFWQADQRKSLADRVSDLAGVLFHHKLGSVQEKVCRIEKLSEYLAEKLEVKKALAQQGARLCKADLVTDMVGEFPQLQGVIGRYYALNQGVAEAVANAIAEHYCPKFSGDKIPATSLGRCISLADRIDTLVGIFACGEIPSGDKDPFALRRASLGVLRILIEGGASVNLLELINQGIKGYKESNGAKIPTGTIQIGEEVAAQIFEYCMERLKGYFVGQGYSAEQFVAVQACHPQDPLDIQNRMIALQRFFSRRKIAAQSLSSANKRITNILGKSTVNSAIKFNRKLICEPAERVLADALIDISQSVFTHFSGGNYEAGLELLSTLKQPVDDYFAQVMVMHQDAAVKANRLAMLAEIRNMFLGVADISRIRIEL